MRQMERRAMKVTTNLSKSGFFAKAPKAKMYLRHNSPLALPANV